MPTVTTSDDNNALFARLIDHHIRFTVAKRRIQMSKHDWYNVAALAVRDMLVEKMLETRARFERSTAKKLYYLSVEYLIGRSLENNLFNLGIFDVCRFGIEWRQRTFVCLHNVNPKVADFAETQPSELRDGFSHLPENVFNRIDAVRTGTCLDQVAQDFPIVTRRARCSDCSVEALQTAIAIDYRAAFFCEAARGQ